MGRREGLWGEAMVANWLRDKGFRLLSSGYHCRYGEVDLIAEEKGVLCFIEVKTRSNYGDILPREYVTPAKQRRLRTTAQWYLATHDMADRPARFDVAEVYTDAQHSPQNTKLHYIRNAF